MSSHCSVGHGSWSFAAARASRAGRAPGSHQASRPGNAQPRSIVMAPRLPPAASPAARRNQAAGLGTALPRTARPDLCEGVLRQAVHVGRLVQHDAGPLARDEVVRVIEGPQVKTGREVLGQLRAGESIADATRAMACRRLEGKEGSRVDETPAPAVIAHPQGTAITERRHATLSAPAR